MRALLWTGPMAAEVTEQPEPVVPPGSELVEVVCCGVCGSDLHGYRGHSPVRTPPLVLGHEVVGTAGAELVVVNPLVGCGQCRLCADGLPNLCPRRGLLGLDRPGAFAERVVAPAANLIPVPPGLDPLVAALTEPLATPLGALSRLELREAVVLVAGCGPIGLLSAWVARRLGAAFVAAFDVDARRVEAARTVTDFASVDAAEASRLAREAGGGVGVDVGIDAVGVEATTRALVESARPGGRVLVIGLGTTEARIPIGTLVRWGIELTGVYAYTPDDFRAAVAMLAEGPPPAEWIATEPLADGPRVLSDLASGRDARVKVVFEVA